MDIKEDISKLIKYFLNGIVYLLSEFRDIYINILYFIIGILRRTFRIIKYIAVIYIILYLIYNTLLKYGPAADYFNSQKPFETFVEVIEYCNVNAGAIQAIATTILVIITAWYAVITHRMLKLENERYLLEWDKRIEERDERYKRKRKEDEEEKKRYPQHRGIKTR